MSDNWIVSNLENAFSTWNDKMTEIWSIITTSPQDVKGGAIWNIVTTINGGLQAIGYALLILFFAMSIFKSTASFRDFQRPEYALKHFIRFLAAKVAITYALDIMTVIYKICGGVVEKIAGSLGGLSGAAVTLPAAIEIMACYNTRKFIYNSAIIYYDNERVWTFFQNIYVHRTCSSSTFVICG